MAALEINPQKIVAYTQDVLDEIKKVDIANAMTAEVGQVIVVKAIDENGKPIEWECINFPSTGLPMPSTAEVGQFIVVSTVDENGNVTATEAVTLPDAEEASF